jgi:hypothetical protein
MQAPPDSTRVRCSTGVVAAIIGMLAVGCVMRDEKRPASAATLVDVLGSDAAPVRKQEASHELVTMGKEAIPVLVSALADARPYERRDIANRMNLPANAPLPAPVFATTTVGQRCRELLYEIITPQSSAPPGRFKVFSEQILQVDDWQAWWAANATKSLATIHAGLRPLVDKYWAEHGTTQKVNAGTGPAGLRDRIGQHVVLDGTARDAKAGAVVVVDGAPVYLDGMEAWPAGLAGALVRVTGTLREQ